jgi:hypothetical protein
MQTRNLAKPFAVKPRLSFAQILGPFDGLGMRRESNRVTLFMNKLTTKLITCERAISRPARPSQIHEVRTAHMFRSGI